MLVPWALGGVLVSLSLLIWVTLGPSGLVVIAACSLVVGEIAYRVIERAPAFGRLAGTNAGLFGGWLTTSVLDQSYGPHLWGIVLLPVILGVVNARLLLEVLIERLITRAGRPDTN